VYQHNSHRVQYATRLENQTDRRKLSEAQILSGAQLMELRDARLRKATAKSQKPPKVASETERVPSRHQVTIIATDIPGSPAPQISSHSEVEVPSDEE